MNNPEDEEKGPAYYASSGRSTNFNAAEIVIAPGAKVGDAGLSASARPPRTTCRCERGEDGRRGQGTSVASYELGAGTVTFVARDHRGGSEARWRYRSVRSTAMWPR